MAAERSIFFVNHFDPKSMGGAQVATRAWTSSFQEAGYAVHWYGPEEPSVRNEPPPQDVILHTIRKRYRFSHPGDVSRLLCDAHNVKPDGIIFSGAWEYPASIMATLLASGQTQKLFVVLHGDQFPASAYKEPIKRLIGPMYRAAKTLAVSQLLGHPSIKIVAVSQSTAETALTRGLVKKDITICHPPTRHDNPECKPKVRSKTATLQVDTTCRISPEKGLENRFIPIAKTLKQTGFPAEFSIVGPTQDAKYFNHLRQTASGSVNFVGARKGAELCRRYNDAHVSCLLSDSEGFGLVTVESLIHGAIPLLTDLPAMREVTQNNHMAAKLISLDDGGITEAVNFLKTLVTQEGLIEQMSQTSLDMGRDYSPQNVSKQLVEYIRREA